MYKNKNLVVDKFKEIIEFFVDKLKENIGEKSFLMEDSNSSINKKPKVYKKIYKILKISPG